MATKVQFINSTGDFSRATRKAQNRLARSHAAAQRQRDQRLRDMKHHRKQMAAASSLEWNAGQLTWPGRDINEITMQDFRATGGKRNADVDQRETDAIDPDSYVEGWTVKHNMPQDTRPDIDQAIHAIDQVGYLLPLELTFSPISYLGQGTDPLVAIPQLKSQRMAKHIFYYANVVMPLMRPSYTVNLVRRTLGCVSITETDEITISALSAFSATSRALGAGDLVEVHGRISTKAFHDSALDTFYYKGKTIHLINSRLAAREKLDATGEDVITGICSLIALEALTGNVNEATAHMNGLKHVLSIWKKQNPGPMSYRLTSKIIACAIKLAETTNRAPLVPFALAFTTALHLPSISYALPNLGTYLSMALPRIFTAKTLSFTPILNDLILMTRYTEATYEWIAPYAENEASVYVEFIDFQDLWIQYRLLDWRTVSDVEESCRLACLLYTDTVLVRGWPNNSAMIRNMVRFLKAALERSFTVDARSVAPWVGMEGVLLWVLFVGAYCSYGQDYYEFFTRAFKNTAVGMGLGRYEDIKELLCGYLFVDRVYEEQLKIISGTSF